jgi:hypothetical protein
MMIDRGYLRALALAAVGWLALFVLFTWTIDPYGVSPLKLRIERFNALKPKRIDIDRYIKPFEVWRDQPRTVFLGTSRIHQSIDPAGFDGTAFGPAYNASIPASTVRENVTHLEQFFRADKQLRAVFAELFLYNFVGPPLVPREKPSLLEDGAALFLSANGAFDAFQTLAFNVARRPAPSYIAPGGFRVPPASITTSFGQAAFIDAIMQIHRKILPEMMPLQTAAFADLDQIVDLCRKNNAELYLLITPNYPWDDYRLHSFGYWPLLEDWLYRVSRYPNVISYSQYNAILEEKPAPFMKYWNDPIHFNLHTGQLMMQAFLGGSDAEIPANFMRRVTPETVGAVAAERRKGLERWSRHNLDFTTAFDRAKAELEADQNQRK